MTKRKNDEPKKKRQNATSHNRTMADIRVKADFEALKSDWPNLNGLEQGQRLRKLWECGCTFRGLGRDLGQPPTTLRNRVKQVIATEANSDWSAMLDTIAPHDADDQKELSPIEAALESK